MLRLADGNVSRVSSGPWNDYHPSWSPDSTRMADVGDRTGTPQIYVTVLETSATARITAAPGLHDTPAWVPVP